MENIKIKLGIIGIGRMGITHYSIINSNPNIEIVAVADTSGVILSIIKKYINKLKIYKDYKSLIDNENIDALLVCTPPSINYKIIKKASLKNINIFVEKPFTTDKEQAIELSQLFKNKKLVNQVGYVNRFNDVFKTVKDFIDNKVIGDLIRFKSEMFSRTIIRQAKGKGWRNTRENGGGAVFEMASHTIDLVNFLIGKPDKVIGSSLNYIYSKNVEDAISSTFLYKNGSSGTIYINWSDESYRKPTNKIEIFGNKGKILADQHSLKIYLKLDNQKLNLRQGWNTLYITDVFKNVPFYVRGNEFTQQLYHFVDCIQDSNIQNKCSFADGVNTLEVIDEIFKDYDKNGKI